MRNILMCFTLVALFAMATLAIAVPTNIGPGHAALGVLHPHDGAVIAEARQPKIVLAVMIAPATIDMPTLIEASAIPLTTGPLAIAEGSTAAQEVLAIARDTSTMAPESSMTANPGNGGACKEATAPG